MGKVRLCGDCISLKREIKLEFGEMRHNAIKL